MGIYYKYVLELEVVNHDLQLFKIDIWEKDYEMHFVIFE